MTKTYLEQHIEKDLRSARSYFQEKFILDVSEAIYEWMAKLNISKKDLSQKLRVSKPRVTKMLDGGSNMTLRTLADIAIAMDLEINFSMHEKGKRQTWCSVEVSPQVSTPSLQRSGVVISMRPAANQETWKKAV